jgi:hypothetical protein
MKALKDNNKNEKELVLIGAFIFQVFRLLSVC